MCNDVQRPHDPMQDSLEEPDTHQPICRNEWIIILSISSILRKKMKISCGAATAPFVSRVYEVRLDLIIEI